MLVNERDKMIYLVRHGKVELENGERRYIGHKDVPLSEEGNLQVKRLAKRLQEQKLFRIFCSDLTRSITTAKIISEHVQVEWESRQELREVSMGTWEGKTFKEVIQHYPEEYAKRGQGLADYLIPGGESFKQAQARIVTAFSTIVTSTDKDILLVGHAGINRLLLCHILGMPIERMFQLTQDYGCMNLLACKAGQYQIKLLNGI